MLPPGGGSHFREIGKDPGYGLPKSRKRYRQDGQPPAGPRLTSWRRLLRPPHGEIARRRSVARGRLLLLAAGLGLILLSTVLVLSYGEDLSPLPGIGGIILLVLFSISSRRPALALRHGAVVIGAMIPIVLILLFTTGPDVSAALVIQSVVPGLAFVVLLVVLVTLLDGSKAAQALAEPEDPVT